METPFINANGVAHLCVLAKNGSMISGCPLKPFKMRKKTIPCAVLVCTARMRGKLLPPPSPPPPPPRSLFIDACLTYVLFRHDLKLTSHLDDNVNLIRDHRMPFIYWSFNWKELQCKFMLAINAETRFLQSAGLAAE